jgi:hypothetical protein
MGIFVDLNEEEAPRQNKHDALQSQPRKCDYVRYTLPQGWRMVDNSFRQDLPEFYIIDADNMKRVSISGAWKGAYDNDLSLHVLKGDSIKAYKAPAEEMIEASETSNGNLMVMFGNAMTPERVPEMKETLTRRCVDFTTH